MATERQIFYTASLDVQESPPRLEVEVKAWGRDRENKPTYDLSLVDAERRAFESIGLDYGQMVAELEHGGWVYRAHSDMWMSPQRTWHVGLAESLKVKRRMDKQNGIEAIGLLREFVECDDIANYDSTLCWGCGATKGRQDCTVDCMLERARILIRDSHGY